MNFGLKQEAIDKINRVFCVFPEVERVILYGSRAKGNYRNGSDIDLTFVGDALDSNILFRIDMELDDLLLPYSFDLSLLKDISNPNLVEHIRQVGVVFYKRGVETPKNTDDCMVESHQAVLTEAFIQDDVEWGLHGEK
jgi:predicted nucleotidyltransferase